MPKLTETGRETTSQQPALETPLPQYPTKSDGNENSGLDTMMREWDLLEEERNRQK